MVSLFCRFLSGLVAGIGGLALAKQAQAAIDIIDDRKVKERGFDIIYEARDVDLPQAQRDGFTQVLLLSLNSRTVAWMHRVL